VYPALPGWAKCVPRLRRLSEADGNRAGREASGTKGKGDVKKNDITVCAKHLRSRCVFALAQAEAYATELRYPNSEAMLEPTPKRLLRPPVEEPSDARWRTPSNCDGTPMAWPRRFVSMP